MDSFKLIPSKCKTKEDDNRCTILKRIILITNKLSAKT